MATIKDLLDRGAQVLQRDGQQSARLEARVLLGYVLHLDHAMLYAYPEREVAPAEERKYIDLLQRRSQGEPVAYITGHKAFYGLDFIVDRRVLIPRPETELLVQAALEIIRQKLAEGQVPVVADIGTGSGVIPVTLAVEEPRLSRIYGCDISAEALAVARLNCERYHVEQRVRLLQGDLLVPVPEPLDVLIANLPYVGTNETQWLTADVKEYEPHLALFSGPDGLDLLKRLCKDLHQSAMLKDRAVILLEIGYQQSVSLTVLLHELWPSATVIVEKDYAGWDRFLKVFTS